jgi:hypothetical protein
LEYLSAEDTLVLSCQKGVFPVSPREFLTVNSYRVSEDEIKILSTSVEDAKAPLSSFGRGFTSPDYVRGKVNVTGWIIKPMSGGVHVTYIVDVDVKGTIPQMLIEKIQVQTPLCILNIEVCAGFKFHSVSSQIFMYMKTFIAIFEGDWTPSISCARFTRKTWSKHSY